MSRDEFSLIHDYFQQPGRAAGSTSGASPSDVLLGIGDDCAVLRTRSEESLVVSTDTLIEGVHFPCGASAEDIAQRSLRVNLSDVAAMGAEPRWFQLALSIPQADDAWLRDFSSGLYAVAREFSCVLVGGDTTRGPLTITITVLGAVPAGDAITRSGGRAGDKVFVTGVLGAGAAGLRALQDFEVASPSSVQDEILRNAFWRPEPRLREGQGLRNIASAMIDISDGLLADLGHIASASGVGAVLYIPQLPTSKMATDRFGEEQVCEWALCGGDDYELCFTVPMDKLEQLKALREAGVLRATEIGELVPGTGVRCYDGDGNIVHATRSGYRHF